ncbi:SCO family protein [Bacillus sp. S10(2024)]|uniref:SCO family protein n=1 Tax=Bacillus sp. S10(2024) TaxID=3162886 RepID=UPI003D1D26A4
MKRFQKWIGLLTAICLLVLAGCSSGSKLRKPLNWDVQSFQYINQNGEKFGSKDLKGKVWVADFVFTNCQTICPPMTANLAKLQKLAKEEKLDVQFVSFSVDPEVDTSEKLKTFVQKFTDDTKNWNLLTGYSQDDIEKFAKDNFKAFVDKPENQDQVIHGTKFYLVDQNGKVMKEYSGMNKTPYDDILRDIRRLTQ